MARLLTRTDEPVYSHDGVDRGRRMGVDAR